MKPLSNLTVAVATVLLTLCASFSSGKESATPIPPQRSAAFKDTRFYWFLTPSDSYDGFFSITIEIGRMEQLYGLYCDTDPTGGTLVAKGYVLPTVPHVIWPSQFIFSH
jgi:hypothetical protein